MHFNARCIGALSTQMTEKASVNHVHHYVIISHLSHLWSCTWEPESSQ